MRPILILIDFFGLIFICGIRDNDDFLFLILWFGFFILHFIGDDEIKIYRLCLYIEYIILE